MKAGIALHSGKKTVLSETSKAMFHVKPFEYELIDLKAAYFLSFRMRAGICPASVSFF